MLESNEVCTFYHVFFFGGGVPEGAATEKAVSPQVRHLCGGPSTGICFPAVGVSGSW